MNKKAWQRTVEQALKNLSSLPSLNRSELVHMQATQQLIITYRFSVPDEVVAGMAVRQLLRRAISHLRQEQPELARLLYLAYGRKKSVKEVSDAFAIVGSTYNLRRNSAIEALASVLTDMEAEAVAAREQRGRQQLLNLPFSDTTSWIKRPALEEQFQHALRKAVKQPTQAWPIVITGLGGIGKTRLVAETLRQWFEAEAPPVEVLPWLHLSVLVDGLWSARRDMLLEYLALSLGLPTFPTAELYLPAIRRHLGTFAHPHLFVVDDIESEADGIALRWIVTHLGAANLALIFISRRRLESEWFTIEVGELPGNDARTLAADLLRDFPGAERQAQALVEQVGGHPQALRLLSGLSRLLPADQLFSELQAGSEETESKFYTPIYQALWDALSDHERALLSGLWLIPSVGATWDGVNFISIGIPALTASGISRVVSRLIEVNLLQVVVLGTQERLYHLHRLTYHFLTVHLTAHPDPLPSGDYLRHQLGRCVESLVANPPPTSLTPAPVAEWSLLLLQRSIAVGAVMAHLRLLERFGERLQRNSQLESLDAHLRHALAQSLSDEQRIRFTIVRARVLSQCGTPEAALALLESAHPFATSPRLKAELYNREGVAWRDKREWANSQTCFEQALALVGHDTEQWDLVSTLYNNLGNLLVQQKCYPEAVQAFEQALACCPAEAWLARARAEGGLALVATEQGDYEDATKRHQSAYRFYRQAGDQAGCIRTLLNRSYLAIRQEQWVTGRSLARRSLALARRQGDRQREARAHHNLGFVYFRQPLRDYKRSVEHLSEALRLRQLLAHTADEQLTREVLQEVMERLQTDDTVRPALQRTLLQRLRHLLG